VAKLSRRQNRAVLEYYAESLYHRYASGKLTEAKYERLDGKLAEWEARLGGRWRKIA
jgi:hypothetical protein